MKTKSEIKQRVKEDSKLLKYGKELGKSEVIKDLIDWISTKGFRECNYEMNELIKHLWKLHEKK